MRCSACGSDRHLHRCAPETDHTRISPETEIPPWWICPDPGIPEPQKDSGIDLAPYDKLSGLDIDEKQENLNQLVADLTQAGYWELAQKVNDTNEELRRQLKLVYKDLPRCVFQGDENFSNLCVDENDQIVGLFDFNMSGTEVIANYLANNAFMGHFCYEDEILDKHTAKEVLQMLLDAFHRSTELTCQHYSFTEQEFYAYRLYAKIVMISAYWNTSTFGEYLQQEKYKAKIAEIIDLILDEDVS